MYKRILSLDLWKTSSCFLWSPRQTGKSTLLKSSFPKAQYYDLLLSDIYLKLINNPKIIREECEAQKLNGETQENPIIIDEIQKIPILLDEIHWLIENRDLKFILCGSSARKLKRGRGNLLGGRAIRYELFPLCFPEIPDFNIENALNSGLIPRYYQSVNYKRLFQSYIGDYLKEEIVAEALTRNIPAFSRFLEIAALSNGEQLNYQKIASDCSISAPTVKEYYQILIDTLIGRYVQAFRKRLKRRLILTPKFYFFDIGVVGHLARRGEVKQGSELYGKAFEHFIYLELLAYSYYSDNFYPISYWRTAGGVEIDFILGDADIAIEVKSANQINNRHLQGMRSFNEEGYKSRLLVVSMDSDKRKTDDNIEIYPWRIFLESLWNGKII